MQLFKLLEGIEEKDWVENKNVVDVKISSLSHDSRLVKQGALFFCLEGSSLDGHDYAKKAVQNGAVAVITQKRLDVSIPQVIVRSTRVALAKISAKFYGNAHEHLKIIGITGTNGKTTTAHMLANILKEAGKEVGIIGTLGANYLGKEYPCALTTPDPIELHKIFADMFLCGVEYVIMEVSAHALHYDKLAGISFTATLLTNVTQDHLDFFTTMEAYKSAKKRLFSGNDAGIVILNGDDACGRIWGKERLEDERINTGTYFYGITEPADAFALITSENLLGSSFIMNVNDEIACVRLPMTGRHNVYNALSAGTCAYLLGIDMSFVAKGLTALTSVRGRLELVAERNGAKIFVDFAHTPDGLQKSLCALKEHCKGRLICLFGCGGNRDKGKRALMGEIAGIHSDFSVLTSDNPRYEDPLDILSAIEKGFRRFSSKYVVVPERKCAIEYAIGCLHKDDVLLVAGKGGERYQEIMGIKYDFDDKDIIEETLLRQSVDV